jgi:hypothetical protein
MNRSVFRIAGLLMAAAVALQLTGCATPMGAPQASIDNTTKLRTAGIAPASLGSFTLAPGQAAGMDQGVSLRGSRVHSPYNDSFAQYLKETLRVELDAAGLLDPASQAVISGTLTESDADAAIGQGTARLAARFVVTRGQAVAYDRTLRADASWESSFVGAVAIPLAAGQYQGLYRKLAGQLFEDPEFRKALARPAL